MKKIILFFLLFNFFGFKIELNAQLTPLAAGIQKYRQGDLEGAIPDFETAYAQAQDKEKEKIENYLFNCCVAVGTKYVQENNYPKAIDYLERALKLNPEDQEVNDLYQRIKAKIAPPAPPKPVVEKIEEIKPEKITKPIPPPEEKRDEFRKFHKQFRKEIVQVQRVQDEFEEKLKLMLARIDRERENLLQHFTLREEKERERILKESQKFIQRTTLIFGIGFLFLIFFILRPIYSNVRQITKTKDKIFREYEERITKMIEGHKISLASFIALPEQLQIKKGEPTKPLTSPEEIIKSAPPQLRLQAINIIGKELNYEDETEKIVALRLLDPFLSDTDKKVQLQAVKTFSKYAPAKAAHFLRDLISKKGKEITPETILTLAEFPPIGKAEILISFLNHPDSKVREEVVLSLEHLLKTEGDEFPPVVIDRIEKAIEKIATDKKQEGK